MIERKYIRYKESELHYIRAGNGKDTLMFFHGFGQDHSVYQPLIQSLAEHFTLYIFDLYFHGKSKWAHDEIPLEKDDWRETIRFFLQENNVDRFSIVGFSLGGKFAIATMEAFPEKTKNLFLIAPDGIKTSLWYSMATYPLLLRKFFKGMITNHSQFLQFASVLDKLRLVDKGLIRFADYQMGTEAKRRRVYYSWVVFRHFTFDIKKVASIINTHQISTTVIVGKYDKVIMPQNMKRFLKHLKNYKFEILESGHNGLIFQSLPFIKNKE